MVADKVMGIAEFTIGRAFPKPNDAAASPMSEFGG
jgi:hypothetical protein